MGNKVHFYSKQTHAGELAIFKKEFFPLGEDKKKSIW